MSPWSASSPDSSSKTRSLGEWVGIGMGGCANDRDGRRRALRRTRPAPSPPNATGKDSKHDSQARRVGDDADKQWCAEEPTRSANVTTVNPVPGALPAADRLRNGGGIKRRGPPSHAAANPAIVPGTIGKRQRGAHPGGGDESD